MSGGPPSFGPQTRSTVPSGDSPGGLTAVRIYGTSEPSDAIASMGLGAVGTPIDDTNTGALALAVGYAMEDAGTTAIANRSRGDDEDNVPQRGDGIPLALARGTLFDPVTEQWSRARMASTGAVADQNGVGVALVAGAGNWSQTNAPATATQATTTRAAPGADNRHVITSIDAALIIPATINQPLITLQLISNATVIWSRSFGFGSAIAAAQIQTVSLSGLNIVCGADEAVTLAFSAAGVATTQQSVSLTGYTAV